MRDGKDQDVHETEEARDESKLKGRKPTKKRTREKTRQKETVGDVRTREQKERSETEEM